MFYVFLIFGLPLSVHTLALFFCACKFEPGTTYVEYKDIDQLSKFKDTKSEEWRDKYGFFLFCEYCQKYRLPQAHHCRECKRCIDRMDHHCPWIDNCVGAQTLKYFLGWLLSCCVFILACWVILFPAINEIRLKGIEA